LCLQVVPTTLIIHNHFDSETIELQWTSIHMLCWFAFDSTAISA
jgi:hypothetical protein